MKQRADSRFFALALGVKDFLSQAWTVEDHRVAHCLNCDAPARLAGRLQIYGHGIRERIGLGPAQAGDEPAVFTLRLRRYRCLVCRAVMTVGPGVLLRAFLYTATAIAWALSLWAVDEEPVVAVRRQVSPWPSWSPDRPRSWRSLTRWVERARAGLLWEGVHAGAETQRRPPARRVVEILRGVGPPLLTARERLHFGVVHAGCGRID